MDDNVALERERSLETVYKTICEFEKPHYEKLKEFSDGSITITVDPNQEFNLENAEIETMFDPVKYPSYRSAFNRRYRNSFKRNLSAINVKLLEKELGKETLHEVVSKDHELRKQYEEATKERDLDNDGIPDRIDIDDTRNSVQSVKDLDQVRNSTSASTQRYNEKQERERREQRTNDLEL